MQQLKHTNSVKCEICACSTHREKACRTRAFVIHSSSHPSCVNILANMIMLAAANNCITLSTLLCHFNFIFPKIKSANFAYMCFTCEQQKFWNWLNISNTHCSFWLSQTRHHQQKSHYKKKSNMISKAQRQGEKRYLFHAVGCLVISNVALDQNPAALKYQTWLRRDWLWKLRDSILWQIPQVPQAKPEKGWRSTMCS